MALVKTGDIGAESRWSLADWRRPLTSGIVGKMRRQASTTPREVHKGSPRPTDLRGRRIPSPQMLRDSEAFPQRF
jgi:ribosomal protein L32E